MTANRWGAHFARVAAAIALLVCAGPAFADQRLVVPDCTTGVSPPYGVGDYKTPTMTADGRDCSGASVSLSPTTASPVVSASAEASHVLKNSAGNLLSLTVTIGATSGYLMVFDATSAPSDGAVTPKFCRYVKSDGTSGATSLAWLNPLVFASGISVAFSSTGCFTKTASATAFFSGQVQ
jgi:hypothetical protein